MNNLLACLGRQDDAGEAPATPNIDKLKTFVDRFKQDSSTETSFISRPNSTELCEWTKKVCEYLPNATDAATAGGDDMRPMKSHFSQIKQFYDTVQQAGWTQMPPVVQTFMSSIQIYECVSGLACVVFAEHPSILKVIENQLTEAREAITQHGGLGVIGLLCCGSGAILARVSRVAVSMHAASTLILVQHVSSCHRRETRRAGRRPHSGLSRTDHRCFLQVLSYRHGQYQQFTAARRNRSSADQSSRSTVEFAVRSSGPDR